MEEKNLKSNKTVSIDGSLKFSSEEIIQSLLYKLPLVLMLILIVKLC